MITNGMYEPNYALLFEKCHHGDINYIRENCAFEIINVQNQIGITLLALACLDDNNAMVQELMKFLPNINIKTKNGHSAATFAISNNNLNNLKILIEKNDKFDFNDTKIIESSLLAIIRGHEDLVQYLIDKGLDSAACDRKNNNVLMYACRYGLTKICLSSTLKVLNINAKNSNRDTALLIAVENNRNDCVDILIAANAQINIQNKHGVSPLMIAIRNNNHEITKKIIDQKNLIINAQDNNGHNALMDAVMSNDLTTTYTLLKKPEIDIELVNKHNQSALMLAIKNNNEEIAILLLKSGSSQRGVDSFNFSCLDYAKKNKNELIIRELTHGEDHDLEDIKNRIIAKLNHEIQNLEDSIQEIIFSDINQLAKKKKLVAEYFQGSKFEYNPNNNSSNLSKKNENIDFKPRFYGEKKLNQVLLNSENMMPIHEVKVNPKKVMSDSKKTSLETQKIIQSQLSKNLIEQLENKYKIRIEEKDLKLMNFKDIILSSIMKNKPKSKKLDKQNIKRRISLNAMIANEEW